ncbi:hypothetical protein D3C81_2293690 [compost metagenome]
MPHNFEIQIPQDLLGMGMLLHAVEEQQAHGRDIQRRRNPLAGYIADNANDLVRTDPVKKIEIAA